MPHRAERDVPIIRRSIPAEETLDEMIGLMPGWLQEQLRADVPRELQAEARGMPQPIRQRTMQTTFLERTAQEDRDDDQE